MLIDLNAEIKPGKSAAGIDLGITRELLLAEFPELRKNQVNDIDKYISPSVYVWLEENLVTQVGVTYGYMGKLNGVISIGSVLQDIQNKFGIITEDEDDNLIVASIPGFCFETEIPTFGEFTSKDLDRRIGFICVYS